MLFWSHRFHHRHRPWRHNTWHAHAQTRPAVAHQPPRQGATNRGLGEDTAQLLGPEAHPRPSDGSGVGFDGGGGGPLFDARADELDLPSFFAMVHEFLFGAGAPPPDSRLRLKVIAETIRAHNCVISGEALVPLLHPLPDASQPITTAIAPILLHFRGRPLTDPASGALLFEFPDLRSAEAAAALRLDATDERNLASLAAHPRSPPACTVGEHGDRFKYLGDGRWQFTHLPRGRLRIAAGFGVANLVGVLAVRRALEVGLLPNSPATALLSNMSGFLLSYAISFLALPCGRFAVLAAVNRIIDSRNRARQERAHAIATPLTPSVAALA